MAGGNQRRDRSRRTSRGGRPPGGRGGSPPRRTMGGGGGTSGNPPSRNTKMSRRLLRWTFAVGVVVVALLIILSFAITAIFPGGGPVSDNSDPRSQIGEKQEDIGAEHIPNYESYDNYNTHPPTSGPHWNVQNNPIVPASCRVYDEQQRNERTVHNLEHGHIVISYNLTDQAMIDDLTSAARNLPGFSRYAVVQPYAQIAEGEITMAAWGWLQRFTTVDPEGMKAFYDAHRGRGPEGDIPC